MRAAENVRTNRQYQVMVSLSKQPIIKSVYKVHQIIDESLQLSTISYFIHCKSTQIFLNLDINLPFKHNLILLKDSVGCLFGLIFSRFIIKLILGGTQKLG